MRILRALMYVIIAAAVLFAIDRVVFELRRLGGGGMGTVAVDQFLTESLKGNKAEYDFLGTVNQNCSRSLFPQYAEGGWNPPCWWLERHKTQWRNI